MTDASLTTFRSSKRRPSGRRPEGPRVPVAPPHAGERLRRDVRAVCLVEARSLSRAVKPRGRDASHCLLRERASWITAAYVAIIAIGLRIAIALLLVQGPAAFHVTILINGKRADEYQRCVT